MDVPAEPRKFDFLYSLTECTLVTTGYWFKPWLIHLFRIMICHRLCTVIISISGLQQRKREQIYLTTVVLILTCTLSANTNFLPNTHQYTILIEKHPFYPNWMLFYNNLLKIYPIFEFWAPSSLMKTHRSLYQILRNSTSKGRHIYEYHVNVRPPHG